MLTHVVHPFDLHGPDGSYRLEAGTELLMSLFFDAPGLMESEGVESLRVVWERKLRQWNRARRSHRIEPDEYPAPGPRPVMLGWCRQGQPTWWFVGLAVLVDMTVTQSVQEAV